MAWPAWVPAAAGTSGGAVTRSSQSRLRRGRGSTALTTALGIFAADYFGTGELALVSRARHRALLQDAADALGRATQSVLLGEEIVAEELRTAAQALGRLTGRVDVEDVLAKIFKDFCIGK